MTNFDGNDTFVLHCATPLPCPIPALATTAANGPYVVTRYVQDLAAPLSQVLQSTPPSGSTTTYLYGLERLAG